MAHDKIGVYSVPEAACETPCGSGKIVHYEVARRWTRLGVLLDNNPFNFSPAYFFWDEVTGYNPLAATRGTA